MNSINTDESSRPFGFWLKAVDRLMAIEFAAAFESEGISRRGWRQLNIIDGTVPDGRRKSNQPSPPRKLPAHKIGRLIELGWVRDADGTWTLTDEGRAAKERLSGIVDGIRAKVTDAVSTEDLATTIATLEQLARAFGWDEETPLPRRRHGDDRRGGFGHRGFGQRGFDPRDLGQHGRGPRCFGGHGFAPHGFGGRGFGPHGFGRGGHDFGHHPGHGLGDEGRDGYGPPSTNEREECRRRAHGFSHDHEEGHGRHRGHARARFAHFTQGSYERGFDAGFTRGRTDR